MANAADKTVIDVIFDGLKVVMAAGGLMLLWNMSGTLSGIQTEIKSINRVVEKNDNRITYLERMK